MRRRTWVAWAVGAGVGLAGGLVAALVPGHVSATPAAAPKLAAPGDRVRAAITGVEKNHLYVAPEVADRLTTSQLRTLRASAAKASVPTYLVYWGDEVRYGGYETDYDALDQLAAGVGTDGYYAIVPAGGVPIEKSVGYKDPFPDPDATKDRPYTALSGYLSELSDWPAERTDPPGKDTFDYWGGPGGGLAAGLMITVPSFFVLIGLVALAGWVRRVWRSS